MQKSFLICFTGVDGSGKTTHAKSLMNYLNEKGFSCMLVWGASRLILSYPFFGFTRMLGYWREVRKNAYTDPLEFAPRHVAKKLEILLRILLFIDFQIRTSLKIRLPLILGKSVVCDRYFYDLLMELHLSSINSERFTTMLSRSLPQPLITFLMDAPEPLTSQRRGFSSRELAAKRQTFLRLGRLYSFAIVDASKDFLSNQKKIRALALARIGACRL